MWQEKISDCFVGVAAKYLSAVDAEASRSHQHEIGGLPSVGFKDYLGTPGKTEEFRFHARQIYLGDEATAPVICDSEVTWYDARRKVSHRSPEYRLYYYDSPVTECLKAGDFFLIAKLKPGVLPDVVAGSATKVDAGSVLMIFTPAGSVLEHQLRSLFGLSAMKNGFTEGSLETVSLLLPLRLMLADLGIDLSSKAIDAATWLQQLIAAFGGSVFPSTTAFSTFARDSLGSEICPCDQPDMAVLAWMEREEQLFKIYERHLVKTRLRQGFGAEGEDVEAFINYSLSVQNRRKSRAGHAFEGHLQCLFAAHGLAFELGRGKGKATENNAKPDFLFPSFNAYHNPNFPSSQLFMLGAKTSCKDRWRQVLSEAKRIPKKHLITLEPAISPAQTTEMQAHQLQLVIPKAIHATYTPHQQTQLLDVQDFIEMIKHAQV